MQNTQGTQSANKTSNQTKRAAAAANQQQQYNTVPATNSPTLNMYNTTNIHKFKMVRSNIMEKDVHR